MMIMPKVRPQKTSFNVHFVAPEKYGAAYQHQKLDHRAMLNYIHADRSHLNESWHKEYQTNGHPKTLRNYLADVKKIVKEKTTKSMQKKAEPKVIGEAVVVIDDKTTMADLQKLGKAMEERFGWTCVQIHVHRDEGYLGERSEEMKHREGKYNLHAHMFFITTNLQTGKSWKMKVGDGSAMQDITAKELNLTRGVPKHLQQGQAKETVDVLEYKEKVLEEGIARKAEQSRQLDKSLKKSAGEVTDLQAEAARLSAKNQQIAEQAEGLRKQAEQAKKDAKTAGEEVAKLKAEVRKKEEEIEGKKELLTSTIEALSDARKLDEEARDKALSDVEDLQAIKIATELEIEENKRRLGDYQLIRQLIEQADKAERENYKEIVARHTSRGLLGYSTDWQGVAEEIAQNSRTVKMAKPALSRSERSELEEFRAKEREVRDMELKVHNARRKSIGAIWDTFVANCITIVRTMTTAMMTTIWDWGLGIISADKSRGTLLEDGREIDGQTPHAERMEALKRSQTRLRGYSQSEEETQTRKRGLSR